MKVELAKALWLKPKLLLLDGEGIDKLGPTLLGTRGVRHTGLRGVPARLELCVAYPDCPSKAMGLPLFGSWRRRP